MRRVALLVLVALAACDAWSGLDRPAIRPALDLAVLPREQTTLETRRIELGGRDRSALERGWSQNERELETGRPFVWATRRDAVVSFRVLEVEDKQFLATLKPFPFLEADQEIDVLVNDREVTKIRARGGFLEYRFVAPAEILHEGENRLTFRHRSLARALNRRDPRSFAAGYASILIGPNCLPLRPHGLPPEPRASESTAGSKTALVVTGPAEITYRVAVPDGAVLRYRVLLEEETPGPVAISLRAQAGDTSRTLDQLRLSHGLLGRSREEGEIAFGGLDARELDLAVAVRPDRCRAAIATVRFETLAFFVANVDGSVTPDESRAHQ